MYLIKKVKLALQEGSFSEIISRFVRYCCQYLYYPYCLFVLRIKSQKNGQNVDSEDYFNLAFRKFNGLIRPSQIENEYKQLYALLAKRKIKNILEIGTATGGTLFLLSSIADPNAKVISIDLPGGYFGGGYSAFKIPLYKSFARYKQEIKLIRKDSHAEETFNELKVFLNGEFLDFIFIDGDHNYTGVKNDFNTYRTLLSKNGIIAFHDIARGGELAGDVAQFWSEIKLEYENLEFINDKNQSGCGIGVLFLSDENKDEKK